MNVEEKTLLETYSRSQLAPSYSVKEKSIQTTFFFLQLLLNRQQRFNPETRALRVTQFSVCKEKKRPFVAELSMSCERRLHDSELPTVVSSDMLFHWASRSETKEHGSMPAGPEAKESPGFEFFDLMAFSSEVLIFFCTVVQC